jgi:LuxR family maltose regulon positive regulatory protein
VLIDRGMIDDGEPWLDRADPLLTNAPEPAATVGLRHAQGLVAFARGDLEQALSAYREGERLTFQLRAPHFLAIVERHWQLRTQLALGDHEAVHTALADADGTALWCNLRGRLALAENEPEAAANAVASVVAGEAFVYHPNFEVEALMIDAVARTQLGDNAEDSVERALAIAAPQGRAYMFLTIPGVADVLARHPVHRTAHAGHLKRVNDLLGGAAPAPAQALAEPLSERELAVLRFLPTNLSAAEIGSELFLSVHTVKTHMRKLYAKLDVHTRAEAVQRGRELGLLGTFTRIV